MSKYSRQQEARMERYFETHPDIVLLKYYGSRITKAGDFLIRIRGHQIRVDHKSTVKDNKITIMKKWLPELSGHCLDRMDQEGSAIPVITLSSKNHSTIWAMSTRHLGRLPIHDIRRIKMGKKSILLHTGWFYDLHDTVGKIDCDGYLAYIMTIDRFIEEIKNV